MGECFDHLNISATVAPTKDPRRKKFEVRSPKCQV